MISIAPAARRVFAPLALAVLVASGLTGCSEDVVAPTAPETLLVDVESISQFELPVPEDQKPSRPSINLQRLGVRLVNQPGIDAPRWAHFGADGRFLREFASFEAAQAALQNFPRNRGRHLGVAIDYTSPAHASEVIGGLVVHLEEWTSRANVQALLAADAADLNRRERFQRDEIIVPALALLDDLRAVEVAIDGAPVLERRLWAILRAFVETLTSSEDHRHEDHDGDGTPNSRDDDYSGTVWKNGPITVTGGGSTTTISVGGCIDPCSMGFGGC